MQKDDQELVQACLNGAPGAWNVLVDRYSRLVYSIPRRYRLSEADADDVFQSVFTHLFQQLSTLRDQSRLASWLMTTAHRESWRVSRRAARSVNLDDVISNLAEPDAELCQMLERQHLVRQGLSELGGRCEKLLTALFFDPEHPDYETIAARLGVTVGSIGPSRARCFEKLMRILRRLGI